MFDRARGFFIGRTDDGAWRSEGDEYDPAEWGFDYTETNGWGTAFTAPHDGCGLAELHGGEEALGRKLDAFFATAEKGEERDSGSYGFAIHEMAEARDVRMGMLGLSNQPAHHIPFMYMFAGRHDDAHRVVAEARDRLFVGSDIGQGYPGDENNGEMSAWYLFAALGLYPLVPASGSYVLVPPLVPHGVIRPEGGAPVTITVVNPEAGGRYIRGVRVNGAEWRNISIGHAELAAGAHIEFELSAAPCGWAADSRPVSASEMHGFRDGLADRTGPGAGHLTGAPRGAEHLVDDLGQAPVELTAGDSVEFRFGEPTPVGLYTVTAAEPEVLAWRVDVRADEAWVVVDRRAAEEFEWAGQTRPFLPALLADRPGDCPVGDSVAIRFTALRPCSLQQLEFFAPSARHPHVDA